MIKGTNQYRLTLISTDGIQLHVSNQMMWLYYTSSCILPNDVAVFHRSYSLLLCTITLYSSILVPACISIGRPIASLPLIFAVTMFSNHVRPNHFLIIDSFEGHLHCLMTWRNRSVKSCEETRSSEVKCFTKTHG